MSKYYKAEDVINLLATEYYTHALAEGFDVKESSFKEDAIHNTKHLPTIEVSEDCISREYLEEQLQLIEDITAMAHIDLGEDPYDETEEITMPISTVRKIFKKAPSVVPTTELVHCKECKFKRLYDGETKYFYCALEDRPNRNWSVDEWNFCWWGERIEE